MTQEEKAKAYDEAREKIAVRFGTNVAEEIFSEFEESEDERIRKGLINYFNHHKNGINIFYGIKGDDILAWLEKQGEKIDIANKEYWRGYREGKKEILDKYAELEKQGEQKPTQEIEPFEAEHGKYYYCIKDYFCGGRKQASKGDVVQALRGLPIMGLKDAGEYFLPVNSIKCNSAWSEEDERTIHNIDAAIRHEVVFPIDELKSMEIWLESLKYRVCPKHEWKRDEKMFQLIEDVIDVYRKTQGSVIGGIHTEELKDFLNCIASKQDWKPSDEQIEILDMVLTNESMDDNIARILRELREQLKKLREE